MLEILQKCRQSMMTSSPSPIRNAFYFTLRKDYFQQCKYNLISYKIQSSSFSIKRHCSIKFLKCQSILALCRIFKVHLLSYVKYIAIMKFSKSQRSSVFILSQTKTRSSVSQQRKRSVISGKKYQKLPEIGLKRSPDQQYGLTGSKTPHTRNQDRLETPRQQRNVRKMCSVIKDIKRTTTDNINFKEKQKRRPESVSAHKNSLIAFRNVEETTEDFEDWSTKQEEVTAFYMRKYSQLSLENVNIQLEKYRYENMTESYGLKKNDI